jgi:hypothetical protein
MEHYHRNHPHTSFPRDVCPICHAQYGHEYMEAVAAFLTANGFDIVDIGDMHVTIMAPSKPRKKFGTLITKETDALYQLLSGRTEPQAESLLQDNAEIQRVSSLPEHESIVEPGQDPLNRLNAWLDELKVQIRDASQPDAQIEIHLIERIQAKIQDIQDAPSKGERP